MLRNNLTNLGIITVKIPEDMFNSIKTECSNVSVINHVKFNTGFNREGMPEHFLVSQCKDDIKSLAIKTAHEYTDRFRQAIDRKMKSEGKLLVPELEAGNPWINIQRKHQYIPNHDHAGFLSYSLWVKVPEVSKFEFTYSNIIGDICREQINITTEAEGYMLMFPSRLVHCVYPFYNSSESRISISGNVNFKH